MFMKFGKLDRIEGVDVALRWTAPGLCSWFPVSPQLFDKEGVGQVSDFALRGSVPTR